MTWKLQMAGNIQPIRVGQDWLRNEMLPAAAQDNVAPLHSYAHLVKTVSPQVNFGEIFLLNALKMSVKEQGFDHPAIQGRFFKRTRMESLLLRACAISEKGNGSDHPLNLAVLLSCLALIYVGQRKSVDAERLQRRALTFLQEALGPDHMLVASALNNLAATYSRQNNFAQARPLYHRSLGIAEQHLGSGHPDVATRLSNLASLYAWQGQYLRAELLHLRSLVVWEKTLRMESSAIIANGLNNLALVCAKQGKREKAERLLLMAQSMAGTPVSDASLQDVETRYRNWSLIRNRQDALIRTVPIGRGFWRLRCNIREPVAPDALIL